MPEGDRRSNAQQSRADQLVGLLRLATDYLKEKGVEDARLEAELLLGDLLGMDRVSLYLHFDRPMIAEEKDRFRERLRRRSLGEPIQYILGHTEFYGRTFEVQSGVLIPRPETELIVDLAGRQKPTGGFRRACDIGCGSGILGLTLLLEGIAQEVVAVDIAPEAIETTLRNAHRFGFNQAPAAGESRQLTLDRSDAPLQLTLVQADAFGPGYTPTSAPFELVVSNPPYVSSAEMEQLPRKVQDHEPHRALHSGKDGLDAHRALATALPDWLEAGGRFFGEIGYLQGGAAAELHRAWATEVKVHRDLNGQERVIEATRGGDRP